MARKAQKRSPAERDAFLEQFRWLRKKSLKDDTKKRFFTKYVIGKTRVCQRHLCLPKARGQKPNHQQNEILAEFFQEIPKERSHYCLHSELLYIQGFPTLLLLFREFQRQNPGAILSRSKFTTFHCISKNCTPSLIRRGETSLHNSSNISEQPEPRKKSKLASIKCFKSCMAKSKNSTMLRGIAFELMLIQLRT